jgi:hypothetical protein
MMRLASSDGSKVATNYTEEQTWPDRYRLHLMEGLLRQEEGTRFIGTLERFEEGWRASFRLRVPSEVFAQPGQTEVFATELQATKWLHTQATSRGFSSIELQRQG